MISGLIAIALAASGTEGSLGRWWWIINDPEQIWFADGVSLQQNGNMRRTWIQTVRRVTGKDRTKSKLVRYEVDCLGRTLRQAEGIAYGEAGDVVRSFGAAPVQSIAPDSVGETVAMFMCADPAHVQEMMAFPLEREPAKVAKDIYTLVRMGLSDEQAALMASFDVRRSPDKIEKMIDQFFPSEQVGAVRNAYGLPLRSSF